MPTSPDDVPSTVPIQEANGPKIPPSATMSGKPVVVGIYGVSGCGKTYTMNLLKHQLGEESFGFYEGSEVINSVVPGGLEAFKGMSEEEKLHWREIAIGAIQNASLASGKVAVVTGHFMFWTAGEEEGEVVCTEQDLNTFTHIIYLNVSAKTIAQRRRDDTKRGRPPVPFYHLDRWQSAEKSRLQELCRLHGILFSVYTPHFPSSIGGILTRLRDFRLHSEAFNLLQAESKLDETVGIRRGELETMLVMDADKTLAPEDTGALFWKTFHDSNYASSEGMRQSLREVFDNPLGYSYTAFRQAALLYQELDDECFEKICSKVASQVSMRPEFVALLHSIAEPKHIGAVIATCGVRCIWEKILKNEGLSGTVKVIGGGRISDGFVVTPAVKGALVNRLQSVHGAKVWAFGDSPLDLPMLSKANQAIVVVGEDDNRSSSMEDALADAIDNDGLRACQVVLPSHATPRLDTTRLPLVRLTDGEFIDRLLFRPGQLVHATKRNAAKLLMTPMRDAKISGPPLRESHRQAGRYLATEFLGGIVGLEEFPIKHVQGRDTVGHRLFHEQQTLIVPLMRGGEPMAFGVNDAFPLATLLHAKLPDDIKDHHLQGQFTVVLVDSVVNSGKSVIDFVQHIYSLHATIRIVVVAGVVQAQAVSGGPLAHELACHPNLSVIALRLSDNKFTGRGTTDTGNRLFNTTHLD